MKRLAMMTIAVLIAAVPVSALDLSIEKTYEHTNGGGICATADGGFVLTGKQTGDDWLEHAALTKIDSAGEVVWSQFYDFDEKTNGSDAITVEATGDGGFIVGGSVNNESWMQDFLIFKVDADGGLEWWKSYTRAYMNIVYGIGEVSGGGFIGAFEATNLGSPSQQAYMMRVDAQGDSLWAFELGGEYEDNFRDVAVAPDGGFVFVGRWRPAFNQPEGWILKTDAEGNEEWSLLYQTLFKGVDVGADGSIYAVGDGITVVKLDAAGNEIFNTTVEGADGNGVVGLPDGGCAVTGVGYLSTDSGAYANMVVASIGPSGEIRWREQIGGEQHTQGFDCALAADGGLMVYGTTTKSINELSGGYVIKIDNVAVSVENDAAPEGFILGQNTPNPFNPETTISYYIPVRDAVRLDVFNIAGQKIRTLVNADHPAGHHTVRWDGRNDDGQAVSSGVYIYRLRSNRTMLTGRMTLVR